MLDIFTSRLIPTMVFFYTTLPTYLSLGSLTDNPRSPEKVKALRFDRN
ncbi:MAG: hypothetical protein KAR39_04270 [Thermoplasmata archaeon]|nr:hypothetical protein [Thermoplasmata archaeon]